MSITKSTQPHFQSTVFFSAEEKNTEAINLEPYLVILSGLDQGKQYRLHQQFNTLGRLTIPILK